MPKQAAEKGFAAFVGGIITEASPLTFPENAAIDMANIVLNRDGSIQRRLGMDFEDSYVASGGFINDQVQTNAISVNPWYNAGDDGSNNFAVVQMGTELSFYDLEKNSISGNKKTFTVDLLTFAKPSTSDIQTTQVEAISGRGLLFVVSSEIEPFFIEYDPNTDTITTTQMTVRIRDLLGVNDGLEVDERPSALEDDHKYNLLNQGWVEGNLSTANGAYGGFPSNADLQSLARNDDNTLNFNLNQDQSIVGTTPAAKGSVIFSPFNRDRTGKVSGIQTITDNGRPETVEFFAGRLWMAGTRSDLSNNTLDDYVWNDTLFFSQTITGKSKVGEFLQEADPTSENISDLIDTDGGTITIPEMGTVIKLVTIRDILLVFADNGVWQVTGDQGAIFTATTFNVAQITSTGAIGRDNIVKLEDKVLYWSDEGIYAIQGDGQTGLLTATNITAQTIQTLYLNINNVGKRFSHGVYDRVARKVRWLYEDASSADGLNWRFRKDSELVLDLDLQAWTKNTIGSLASNSPYLIAGVVTPFEVISQAELNVVVGADNVQVDGEDVVIKVNRVERREVSEVKYLTVVPNSSTSDLTFSLYTDENYVDWVSANSVGVDAAAFARAGHFHGGALPRYKGVSYLYVFNKKTEAFFEDDGSGNLVADNPGSCLVTAHWDYNDTATGNRHLRQFEAYRIRRIPTPALSGDAHDTGEDVVVTKNKLRGKGRALSIRFDSSAGKDFHLLGWHLDISVTIP